jgi:hypothetical protein
MKKGELIWTVNKTRGERSFGRMAELNIQRMSVESDAPVGDENIITTKFCSRFIASSFSSFPLVHFLVLVSGNILPFMLLPGQLDKEGDRVSASGGLFLGYRIMEIRWTGGNYSGMVIRIREGEDELDVDDLICIHDQAPGSSALLFEYLIFICSLFA